MDKRPDASGRPKPREGSLGPNGVSNKFLAELIGKRVDVGFVDGALFFEGAVLLRFDSYSIVIRETVSEWKPQQYDPKGSEARVLEPEKFERDVCLWKGPGLFVRPTRP